MVMMQTLIGSYAAASGGELSVTFLGGRRDEDPGRTVTVGSVYSSIEFTTPSSFSTNMPSGTSLVVVAIMFEKSREGYNQSTPRLEDGTNTWSQILQQHADTNNGSGSEVVFMACELSSLPSSFTVHYREDNERGVNTAWYAIQNYTSTSAVDTDVDFDDDGFTTTDGSVSLSWTGSGAVCIAAQSEDKESRPSISGGTEDFYSEIREGNDDDQLTASANSTLATGTSQSFTRSANSGSRSVVLAAVAFR